MEAYRLVGEIGRRHDWRGSSGERPEGFGAEIAEVVLGVDMIRDDDAHGNSFTDKVERYGDVLLFESGIWQLTVLDHGKVVAHEVGWLCDRDAKIAQHVT